MKLDPQRSAQRAIDLASLSPVADPNPRVGCVILAPDGTLLAEGFHRGAGTPHAEAAALHQAESEGVDLAGSTAYVTLEPCAHQGRTPSCARALARSGVRCLVFGLADPNGEASGGATILREAGIEVIQDEALRAGSEELNADWLFSVTHGRPFVRWKFAATLDGFSAASDGTSQWITGAAARADVHVLRAQHGAIVAGTGTVLADDPHLTVRDLDGEPVNTQPLRVVVGDRDVAPEARVRDEAAETLMLPRTEPHAILDVLHHRGIHAVWLEGGPTLAAAFLRAGFVDEVIAYIAPAFLGAGHAAVGDLGIASIADIKRFDLRDVRAVATMAPAVPVSVSDAAPAIPAQADVRLTLTPVFSKEY